jgi:60 kDa SS-A/Ro ribonucleoprotein
MTDALSQVRTRHTITPQAEQADPRQVLNSAGGFTFTVPGEARIIRFLTIGTEGGTFYVSQRALTKDSAAVVLDWARNRPAELVAQATEISVAGRAPRNEPALFAVAAALALGDETGREAAARAVPLVARTGTHLFAFCGYLEQFRGWGRKAQRAVASWYLSKDADQLAYQLVKYRQRDGWTHADVLKLAHPKPRTETGELMTSHDLLFKWVTGAVSDAPDLPKWVNAYVAARFIETHASGCPGVPHQGHASSDWTCPIEDRAGKAGKAARYRQLIADYPGLPWEALPDEARVMPEVWGDLVDAGMPQTALIRQLPTLTRLGVLAPLSARLRSVCDQIRDPERLRKARVHPVSVLLALKTYASGRAVRGSATWTPVPQIADALDEAFYAAFGAVEPAGKRTMIGLDVSASMGASAAGLDNLTCREVTAAMSLVTMATEPAWGVYGFTTGLTPLDISPRMRLDTVVHRISGLRFGGTDCALPMVFARKNRIEVDTFQVWTDNETWAGHMHPHEALRAYRQAMGIDARMQVIAITPTEFSIADPDDPGTLDVSGFDSAVPRLLADHSAGRL